MNSLDATFEADGKIFLVKCAQPNCGLENYAACVASGVCAWCGYDANLAKGMKDFTENDLSSVMKNLGIKDE